MRRITTRSQEAKQKRTKQFIVGGVLIVIMFFSVLGYAFRGSGDEDDDQKINYNGFEFVRQNNFWFLELGDFQFAFKYNPKQVEQVSSQVNFLNTYSRKPLYVFTESQEAGEEIYRNFNPQYNNIVQRMQNACFEECEEDVPIKTCEDNFIIIEESEIVEIIQNQSCVFIRGPLENLTMITDEFLFKIIGVE